MTCPDLEQSETNIVFKYLWSFSTTNVPLMAGKLRRRKLVDTFVVRKVEAAIVITKNCPPPIGRSVGKRAASTCI
jgi:hypothetical protein